MGWYDALPLVGSIDAAAHGHWGQALADAPTLGSEAPTMVGKYAYNKLYKQPADAKKAALDQAAAQAQALGQQGRDWSMQGLNASLAQMKPAQDVYNQLYGDPRTLSVAKAPA